LKRVVTADSRALLPAIALPKVVFPTHMLPQLPAKLVREAVRFFQSAPSPPSTAPPTPTGPPIVKGLVLRAAAPVRQYVQLIDSVPRRVELAMPQLQLRRQLKRATAVGAGAGALVVGGSSAAQVSALLAQRASQSLVAPLMQSIQDRVGHDGHELLVRYGNRDRVGDHCRAADRR
jgi:hypothetical protein